MHVDFDREQWSVALERAPRAHQDLGLSTLDVKVRKAERVCAKQLIDSEDLEGGCIRGGGSARAGTPCELRH